MNTLESFLETITATRKIWLLEAMTGMFAMLEDAEGNSYIPAWESVKKHVRQLSTTGAAMTLPRWDSPNWRFGLRNSHATKSTSPSLPRKTVRSSPSAHQNSAPGSNPWTTTPTTRSLKMGKRKATTILTTETAGPKSGKSVP